MIRVDYVMFSNRWVVVGYIGVMVGSRFCVGSCCGGESMEDGRDG